MLYSEYFKAVSRHKYFVFLECLKMAKETKTPMLIWRGLAHDMSKFLPAEFIPYAKNFYGTKAQKKNTKDAYNEAWLIHQNRNLHHWQWWVLLLDDGGEEALPMDEIFTMEMLCDWKGAAKAYKSKDTTAEWYAKNMNKMNLHGDTRAWIELQLGV